MCKKHVLLVETDPGIRDALGLLLRNNFDVASARDEAEALGMIAQIKFDLVLLDLNMTLTDGWGVFDKIRKRFPLFPIIIFIGSPGNFLAAPSRVAPRPQNLFEIDSLLALMGQAFARAN